MHSGKVSMECVKKVVADSTVLGNIPLPDKGKRQGKARKRKRFSRFLSNHPLRWKLHLTS